MNTRIIHLSAEYKKEDYLHNYGQANIIYNPSYQFYFTAKIEDNGVPVAERTFQCQFSESEIYSNSKCIVDRIKEDLRTTSQIRPYSQQAEYEYYNLPGGRTFSELNIVVLPDKTAKQFIDMISDLSQQKIEWNLNF